MVGYGVLGSLAVPLYTSIRWEFFSQLDFTVVYEYRLPLLGGLGITLLLTGLTLLLGFVAGVAMAIAYQIPPMRVPGLRWRIAPLRWFIVAHVELWRNTPLLVQLFWIVSGTNGPPCQRGPAVQSA